MSAVQHLLDGTITADQTTVAVLTGFGLKAADRIGEQCRSEGARSCGDRDRARYPGGTCLPNSCAGGICVAPAAPITAPISTGSKPLNASAVDVEQRPARVEAFGTVIELQHPFKSAGSRPSRCRRLENGRCREPGAPGSAAIRARSR